MTYVLEQFIDVFRQHLGCEPGVDADEGPEVWTSPKTARGTAVAIARDLVAVDLQERDERLETVFLVMAS
jgi:hypothetical protein